MGRNRNELCSNDNMTLASTFLMVEAACNSKVEERTEVRVLLGPLPTVMQKWNKDTPRNLGSDQVLSNLSQEREYSNLHSSYESHQAGQAVHILFAFLHRRCLNFMILQISL